MDEVDLIFISVFGIIGLIFIILSMLGFGLSVFKLPPFPPDNPMFLSPKKSSPKTRNNLLKLGLFMILLGFVSSLLSRLPKSL